MGIIYRPQVLHRKARSPVSSVEKAGKTIGPGSRYESILEAGLFITRFRTTGTDNPPRPVFPGIRTGPVRLDTDAPSVDFSVR